MDTDLEAMYRGILAGDQRVVSEEVEKALGAGVEPERILREGLIPAMRETGRLFEEGQYFLPEMLVAARAMKAALRVLEPRLAAAHVEPIGTVVIGTVEGDLHDIGKNIVSMMLNGVGFAVRDLGADVKAERFVASVRDGGADIVAMSALLSTTMPNMKKTVDALQAAGLRARVKVLVGGAPLSAERAREMGADGYAEDASKAARLASAWVGAPGAEHA
ncbi:MAG: corrinoid protein [Planctomycetes bacterium]|nr:corrinoid protein [Planctomycetota bacterium]